MSEFGDLKIKRPNLSEITSEVGAHALPNDPQEVPVPPPIKAKGIPFTLDIDERSTERVEVESKPSEKAPYQSPKSDTTKTHTLETLPLPLTMEDDIGDGNNAEKKTETISAKKLETADSIECSGKKEESTDEKTEENPKKTSTALSVVGIQDTSGYLGTGDTILQPFVLTQEEIARSRFYGMGFLLFVLAMIGLFVFDPIPSGISGQQIANYVIEQSKKDVKIYWSATDDRQPIVVDSSLAHAVGVQGQESQGYLVNSLVSGIAVNQVKDTVKKDVENTNSSVIIEKSVTQAREAIAQSNEVKAPAATSNGYVIQVLATTQEAGAREALKRMAKLGWPVQLVRVQKTSTVLWRVRLGEFAKREDAQQVDRMLTERGISHMPIQRMDNATVVERLGVKN